MNAIEYNSAKKAHDANMCLSAMQDFRALQRHDMVIVSALINFSKRIYTSFLAQVVGNNGSVIWLKKGRKVVTFTVNDTVTRDVKITKIM